MGVFQVSLLQKKSEPGSLLLFSCHRRAFDGHEKKSWTDFSSPAPPDLSQPLGSIEPPQSPGTHVPRPLGSIEPPPFVPSPLGSIEPPPVQRLVSPSQARERNVNAPQDESLIEPNP